VWKVADDGIIEIVLDISGNIPSSILHMRFPYRPSYVIINLDIKFAEEFGR